MIEIDRNRVPRPDVLDLSVDDSLASKETAKAIAHALDATKPKPKFTTYSHDDVKVALIQLFNLKCAYCESKVVSARDIEHYRPKGRIDPGTGEPVIEQGYYWLAATWDNLLLSCPDCNQRKRALQRDDQGNWTFADKATGKLDLFPLRDEDLRSTSHTDDLETENASRLLLNPCKDKVTKHVRFDNEGNIIARQLNGAISDMAEASIGTYVLYRPTLVEARKAKFLDMVQCSDEPMTIAAGLVDDPNTDVLPQSVEDLILASLRATEDKLKAFTTDDAEFAGMARWTVKPLLKELADIRQRFVDKFGD